MVKITIYSTPTCPYCKAAKEYFKNKKISFKDVDVSKDQEAQKEMIEKSNQMGVPVIEIDDKIVVGFNQEKIEKLLK